MLVAASLTFSAIAPAFAQSTAAGSASDTAALKKFEDGKKAYDEGRFEEALILFTSSIAMLPSPNSRLYIARCQRAIGRVASSYVSYKLAMREATDRLNATGEKRFKATRDAAASEMAEIEDKVPRLTLKVPSDAPDSFTIKVNDVVLPKDAWGTAVETDPGTISVVAEGPRRKKFSTSFDLKVSEQKVLNVVAERIPSGELKLNFATRPSGLSVVVDGKPLNPAYLEAAIEVDVGKHTVKVQAPGYLDFNWQGDVRDQHETRVDVALKPEPLGERGPTGVPMWVTLTAAGATVITLGAGAFFAARAKSIADDQKSKDPLQRELDEQERVKTLSATANILFIAGSAMVVGTGVLLYLTPYSSGSKDHARRAGAWIAVAPSGLLLEGRF